MNKFRRYWKRKRDRLYLMKNLLNYHRQCIKHLRVQSYREIEEKMHEKGKFIALFIIHNINPYFTSFNISFGAATSE